MGTKNEEEKKSSSTTTAPMPNSFNTFLWPIMKRFRYEIYSPDARIALLARSFSDALRFTVGTIVDGDDDSSFDDADQYFKDVLGDLTTTTTTSTSNLDDKNNKMNNNNSKKNTETTTINDENKPQQQQQQQQKHNNKQQD